jgi:hypothetical protein
MTLLRALLIVLIVTAIGSYLLISSHAAAPYVAEEAENGTLANGANKVTDSTASGGYAVKFGSVGTGSGGSTNSKLRIAVMDTYNRSYIPNLISDVKSTGVSWDRVDVGNGSNFSPNVQNALNEGLKPLIIYNVDMTGESDSTAASQVKAIAQQMQPLGLNDIEFGNEIYCNGCNGWATDPPTAYAAQYDAAHKAIAGMGMTLIADSTGDYELANGTWSQDAAGGGWIHDFLAAMPGGPTEVDAWSIHPYGSMTTIAQGDDGGWPAVPRYRQLAVEYGSTAPWYITEVGQVVSGTGAVSEQQQAADMTQYLNDITTKYTYVVYFDWYESIDDGTGGWGLFDISSNYTITDERPSFTALQTWMAAHASEVNG